MGLTMGVFVCICQSCGLSLGESEQFIQQLTKKTEELDYGSLGDLNLLDDYVEVDPLPLSHDEYMAIYEEAVESFGDGIGIDQSKGEPIIYSYDEEYVQQSQESFVEKAADVLEAIEEKLDSPEQNEIISKVAEPHPQDIRRTQESHFTFVENLQHEVTLLEIIFFAGIFIVVGLLTFGLFICCFRLLCVPSQQPTCLEDQQKKVVKLPGIIKSYTKLPVEIRNMKPSNVAYKELYEV